MARGGSATALVLAALDPSRYAAPAGAPPFAPSAAPVTQLLRRLSRTFSRDGAGGAGSAGVDGGGAVAGGAGGRGAVRPVRLAVEGHPAAKSVVARKMLRRLKADSAWLAETTAAGGSSAPRLKLVEGLNGSRKVGAYPTHCVTEYVWRCSAHSACAYSIQHGDTLRTAHAPIAYSMETLCALRTRLQHTAHGTLIGVRALYTRGCVLTLRAPVSVARGLGQSARRDAARAA